MELSEILSGLVLLIGILFGVRILKDSREDIRSNKRFKDIQKAQQASEKKSEKEQEEVDEKIKSKSSKEIVKRFRDVFSRKPGTSDGTKWRGD